jgi:hypothetical protein
MSKPSRDREGVILALFWAFLAATVLASRLCHVHILWADEDYHLAAAVQVLAGKLPYRDFWYDKPPLNLLFYLLFGARTGVLLRLADSAFVVLCCALAFRFAASLWSRLEGLLAAAALAFFSIFYLAPGIIPEEPDTLMLAPHLAAVYLAFRKRPLLAGFAAGVAFQLNVKGAFVLVSAVLFTEPAGIIMLLVGFLIPSAVVLAWLASLSSLAPYLEQVWKWGFLDAAGSPPYGLGLSAALGLWTVAGWSGFHVSLFAAAVWYWARNRSPEVVKTLVWVVVSLAGVAIGLRFAPRYFMQLLPALLIPAARGFAQSPRILKLAIAAALLIPAIRFGPRYMELARGVPWQDTAMDSESQAAGRIITGLAQPGDTIFIWGYRPGLVAYTRLPVAGRLWDSQPLTGVPANRHLSDDRSSDPEWARSNRSQLLSSHPAFLVDGLSLYNPRLDIHGYPDLAPWLAQYCPVGRAGLTIVYRVCRSDEPAH